MLTCDVVVIGAGPAGAAAAIGARRSARDVIVVDRAHFPRDKFCGDGLTTEALRLLESLGVRPAVLPGWVDVECASVRSPGGSVRRFPLPADGTRHAAVCPRVELDHALVERLVAEGARLVQGAAITALREEADHVVVSTSAPDVAEATIAARYVVAADGMWSPTRKLCGVAEAGYLGEWHAFRQYFSGVAPPSRDLAVWFEPDLLPGYAWCFPVGEGRANVGFGVHRRSRVPTGRLKALWPELLARPHIRRWLGPDARPEGAHRAWPIPARLDRLPLTHGRVLFTGDAAGATDPMTGEGIAQALTTGLLAAEAIAHGGPIASDVTAASYERSVRRHLLADHRFARRLSRLMTGPRQVDVAVRIAGATPWTRRNFARWMFEDYPRALVLTPRRWHRGMFSPPGAFAEPPAALPGSAREHAPVAAAAAR